MLSEVLCKKRYKIFFLKKSAKINKEALKKFVIETLRCFGGCSLLSTLSVTSFEDGIVEISVIKGSTPLVDTAMTLCGICNEMKCCIKKA